jgi:hypothetical protein
MPAMVERIRAAVQEALTRDSENAAAFQAVRNVIAGMEGKKITKRVLPALKTALISAGVATDESTISYSRPYTFSGLEVAWWGKGTREPRYDDRASLVLTKGSGVTSAADDSASLIFYDRANPAMGSAVLERNAQRIALLNDPKSIASLCVAGEAYQRALKTINDALEFEAPFTDRYTIEKIVKGEVES